MGLVLVGIMESLLVLAMALYAWLTLPAADHVVAVAALMLGVVVFVATWILGRPGPRRIPDEDPSPEPHDDHDPEDQATLQWTLPEGDPPVASPGPQPAPNRDPLPVAVGDIRRDVERARWRFKLRELEARARAISQAIRQDSSSARSDDPRRHLRRLCDLAILTQGYDAWIQGKPPVFDLDRYRSWWSRDDIERRLDDLAHEITLTLAEADEWGKTPETRDSVQGAAVERVRYEELQGLEDRIEELELLRLGYASLNAQSPGYTCTDPAERGGQ